MKTMQKATRVFLIALCAGSGLSYARSGGGGGGGGVTDPNAVEVRTLNERVPAGGTVQVKHQLTQPRPITSGGWDFDSYGFAVNGIAVSSPAGDAFGAGVVKSGKLTLSVISPASDFGATLDYPFITIAMDIPATANSGATYPLQILDGTIQTTNGTLTMTEPKPGTLTIGGSVSVRGVYPGGGSYPAGTVLSIRGNGFQPGTKVSTKLKTLQPVYVSPNEITLTLKAAAILDMQPFTVANPDGSQVTYYSYLRGVPVRAPVSPVLQATEPVFALMTQPSATLSPDSCAAGQELAVAVQNPNPWPVPVAITDQSTAVEATQVLPSQGRIVDRVADLLAATGTVQVTATSGIQFIGLCVDGGAFTVTPFAPGL